MFDNDKFVVLVYGKFVEDIVIGIFIVFEGGVVCVWDGDMVVLLVGDLCVDVDGMVCLGKIVDEDVVCYGCVKVLIIYGMLIDKVCKVFVVKGWKLV